jgi:hypothetical protein
MLLWCISVGVVLVTIIPSIQLAFVWPRLVGIGIIGLWRTCHALELFEKDNSQLVIPAIWSLIVPCSSDRLEKMIIPQKVNGSPLHEPSSWTTLKMNSVYATEILVPMYNTSLSASCRRGRNLQSKAYYACLEDSSETQHTVTFCSYFPDTVKPAYDGTERNQFFSVSLRFHFIQVVGVWILETVKIIL